MLLDKGADPCLGDATGNTAQMGMAFRGFDQIAAQLLKTSCDVNTRNKKGQTAIMMAALFGRTAQIKMLVDAGANPSIADDAGNTAAGLANQQGNDELVRVLEGLK